MLANASFDDPAYTPWDAPWSFRNDLGATLSQDKSTAANSAASIKTTLSKSDSSQPWLVSISQGGKTLSAGQTYILTFWAKATGTRPIQAIIQNQDSPYTEYFHKTPYLSSAWTVFSYTFKATASLNSAMLNFNLADAAGSVWLDQVVLCQAGSNCNRISSAVTGNQVLLPLLFKP